MEFFKIQTKSLSTVLVDVYEPVYPNQLLTIFNKVSGLWLRLYLNSLGVLNKKNALLLLKNKPIPGYKNMVLN